MSGLALIALIKSFMEEAAPLVVFVFATEGVNLMDIENITVCGISGSKCYLKVGFRLVYHLSDLHKAMSKLCISTWVKINYSNYFSEVKVVDQQSMGASYLVGICIVTESDNITHNVESMWFVIIDPGTPVNTLEWKLFFVLHVECDALESSVCFFLWADCELSLH